MPRRFHALRWLRAAKPDIVCLQELKCLDAEFPAQPIERAGYGAVWRGEKTAPQALESYSRRVNPAVTVTP